MTAFEAGQIVEAPFGRGVKVFTIGYVNEAQHTLTLHYLSGGLLRNTIRRIEDVKLTHRA